MSAASALPVLLVLASVGAARWRFVHQRPHLGSIDLRVDSRARSDTDYDSNLEAPKSVCQDTLPFVSFVLQNSLASAMEEER